MIHCRGLIPYIKKLIRKIPNAIPTTIMAYMTNSLLAKRLYLVQKVYSSFELGFGSLIPTNLNKLIDLKIWEYHQHYALGKDVSTTSWLYNAAFFVS